MMDDILGDPIYYPLICGLALFCLVMAVLFLSLIKSMDTEAEYARIDREVARCHPNDEEKDDEEKDDEHQTT